MSQASFADWLASRPEGGGAGATATAAPEGGDKSFFGFFGDDSGGSAPVSGSASGGPALDIAYLATLGASALRFGSAAVGGSMGSTGGEEKPATPTPPAEPEWTCGLTAVQRFQAFGLLLLGSISLYFAAIFLFLPMVIFMPAKFATTFTFASIMWMAAFAMLRGPRATLKGLVGDKEKRVFTAAYVGSLALTLYSTIFTSSYFLPLIAIFVQIGAMLWYSSSSIPGGTAAMSAITSWCVGGITGRQTAAGWAGGQMMRSATSAVSGALRS
jgi:hypothetical protein